jgi:5-methyltetrahydrofolate--homocysteine methyltransferase
METRVSSLKKEVIIGDDQPTVLIGERINPAGKKKLAEALKAGDLEIVCQEALAQVQAGADILDVNVGTFGVDEVTLLPKAVQAVTDAVDVPLCIDSKNLQGQTAYQLDYRRRALLNQGPTYGQGI